MLAEFAVVTSGLCLCVLERSASRATSGLGLRDTIPKQVCAEFRHHAKGTWRSFHVR